VQHFGDEEKIMKRMAFPDFNMHHKQHEAFIKNVSDLKGQFDREDGPSRVLALDKLTKFLGEWITHHILVEDKIYGKYLEGE
jgi:hemerythrin